MPEPLLTEPLAEPAREGVLATARRVAPISCHSATARSRLRSGLWSVGTLLQPGRGLGQQSLHTARESYGGDAR